MNKVTVTDKKSGRHVLDRMTQAFYAGHVYSVLLPRQRPRAARDP